MKTVITICGIVFGAGFGYVAGHYFPLWGGMMAVMGEPHSPARAMVARGHVALFSVLFGLIAAGLAYYWCLDRPKSRRSTTRDRFTPPPFSPPSGAAEPPPFVAPTARKSTPRAANMTFLSIGAIATCVLGVWLVGALTRGDALESQQQEPLADSELIVEELLPRSQYESDESYRARREKITRGQQSLVRTMQSIANGDGRRNSPDSIRRRPVERPGDRIDEKTARARLSPEMLVPITGGGGAGR